MVAKCDMQVGIRSDGVIGKGNASYLCNYVRLNVIDKKLFFQNGFGNWTMIEYSRRGNQKKEDRCDEQT